MDNNEPILTDLSTIAFFRAAEEEAIRKLGGVIRYTVHPWLESGRLREINATLYGTNGAQPE